MELCAEGAIHALLFRRLHKLLCGYAGPFGLYKKFAALVREAAPLAYPLERLKLGRKLVYAFAYYHQLALRRHEGAPFSAILKHPPG